jgi:hypothetical protein
MMLAPRVMATDPIRIRFATTSGGSTTVEV